MKNSLLTIALSATMAATMAASTAAVAAPTVYGNIHLSINDADTGASGLNPNNPDMTSNTSAIGVKGSEDLGDGLKAIYKMEFQVNVSDGNSGALTNRDQFVGLKGGMGTVKFGTFSSNYKQKGGKVDSLYRTRLEGRGFMHTQSRLHNGRAINRGRMQNAVSYTSPKMGGIQLVVNTTLSGSDEETFGAGLRWSNKTIMAYLDWIDAQPGTADTSGATPGLTTESAIKVGGAYKSKAFHVGLQYENAEDLTGFNYIHANAGFNFNKNNAIEVTIGTATFEGAGTANDDTTSWAVAYNDKLSKMTNVYLGYGDVSDDSKAKEDTVFTAGIKKKF
jgi:predicted porin